MQKPKPDKLFCEFVWKIDRFVFFFLMGKKTRTSTLNSHDIFTITVWFFSLTAQFSYVDYSVFFSGIKDFKRPAQPRNHVQSDVLRVHNHKFSIDVLGNRILQPGTYNYSYLTQNIFCSLAVAGIWKSFSF